MSAANWVTLAVFFFGATEVYGHEGPPFPVVVDQVTNHGKLSIWSDPDVGEGTFMVFFENERSFRPPQTVQISSDGQTVQAQRSPELDNREERTAFTGIIPYTKEGRFPVEMVLDGKPSDVIRFEIDVTPPGPSRWQIWLFAFPFVALGVLWSKAILCRRRRLRC